MEIDASARVSLSKRASRWSMAMALAALGAFALAPSGCGGDKLSAPSTSPDPSSTVDAGTPPPSGDGAAPESDAAASADTAPPAYDDGTPTRIACTSTLGHGLSPAHGRLDGQLVSVVTPGTHGCPADSTHLHLQVRMNGSVYDIAVNLDGFEGETDAALPGVPYAEGWHEMSLDYVSAFGLHSSAITLTSEASILARLQTALVNVNHISVFGTGYPGSDGAHLIHRKVTNQDGALVLNPLGAKPHVIAFRFDTDTF